jgi:HptB-dependent secretion and biofilm anti anti-sigma factor
MSVVSKKSTDNTTLIISVKGVFDFNMLNEFRRAYSGENECVKKMVVDLRDTSAIDSSALGMLLNMNRYLESTGVEVFIENCNEHVRGVFDITHFNKIFTIE